MTPRAFRLLRVLADGRPHSGAALAAREGVSRTAVWKQVAQLRSAGLPVNAQAGSGYRLAWPLDFLDRQRIRAALGSSGPSFELRKQVDSTNRLLVEEFRHRHAVVAEFQRAGRGRRGRGWLSPPCCGVWLSYGHRFECGLQRLSALSLAVGIGVAEALPAAVRLKWPNDLMVGGRKLGGVLIELRGAAEGPCEAVVGVGVNVRLPADPDAPAPDQPWTDLHAVDPATVDRSRLAGTLITALESTCRRYGELGFDAFADRWRALDTLAGRVVEVTGPGPVRYRGRADGVNRRGELRVATGDGMREVDSGEVSVRAA